MTDVTDDFSSGALSPNWTAWGGNPAVGGGVFTHTSDFGAALWTANTFQGDQIARITPTSFGTNSFWGIALRASGAALTSGDCYLFSVQNRTAAQIWRITGGSFNLLAQLTAEPWSVGQALQAEAVGSTLVLRQGGAFRVSANDATYTSGGIGITAGATALDNFLGGPIVAAGGGGLLSVLMQHGQFRGGTL